MPNLTTRYMNLSLENPLVVGSCSLVKTAEGVKRCADGGAGAVVLKSLFEEQIESDTKKIEENLWLSSHSEAFDYVTNMGMEMGQNEYLKLIEQSKKSVTIPIIASINCVSPKWWASYAKRVANAGADALELNIAIIPCEPKHKAQEIENTYLKVLDEVKAQVNIPVSVKIGPYFTSIPEMAERLVAHGAQGLVFFNRFYQLDIDLEKMEIVPGYRFSGPEETSLPLRWISILAGRVDCDLVASTGIHDGSCAVKHVLAGACAVQICSVLYQKGIGQISKIRQEIEDWMKSHGIQSLEEVRGKLSQVQSQRPEIYERLQYIKALVQID